jgi:hypothetical protein
MVVGLELFRERFRSFQGSFVLIGGAACDDWFGRQRLPFRATKDLDIVLLAEALEETFVREMRRFISDGGYRIRQRSTGTPELYRFAEPGSPDFPVEIELFSRSAGRIDLDPGEIVPVVVAPDHHSLSAILLHDAYYDLVRQHNDVIDGLAIANATSLIPLKAYAWLDLTRRLSQGEQIDSRKIKKHRSDVFRLALTLPATPGPRLPEEIRVDVTRFLESFPVTSPEWGEISRSLAATVGASVDPTEITAAIAAYFRLSPTG